MLETTGHVDRTVLVPWLVGKVLFHLSYEVWNHHLATVISTIPNTWKMWSVSLKETPLFVFLDQSAAKLEIQECFLALKEPGSIPKENWNGTPPI